MKKSLLAILLICVLSLGICVYGAEDTVIYEQDFENYTGGRFETLNQTAGQGSWTALPFNQYLASGTDNGNTYMYFVNDSDTTAMSMTYKFTNAISDGMVVFSYDIAHSGEANTVPRVRMFDGNNTELLTLFINASNSVKKLCGAKPDFKSNVGFGATNVEYKDITADEIVKVMQILSFDDDYFETYINGVLLDRVEALPFDTITAWGVYGYNTISYFDNLSIKTLGDLEHSVEVTGEEGGNGLKINLPESVSDSVLTSMKLSDVTISDKDGNNVALKELSVNETEVLVSFENVLEYDEKYTLKLGIKDKYGRSFEDLTFMSKSEVDENGNTVLRVKNVTGITLAGEEIELKNGVTPEITGIKIEFNTFVSEYENGIKLNGNVLTGSVTDKTVTVQTDGVLLGDTEYSLTVDENVKSLDDTSARAYSLDFKTAEGKLRIKEFGWVTESGDEATASDVTTGAKLKLLFKTVNTTAADENMYLTYSTFSGNIQTKVMLKPVLSRSGKYDEFELEHTVAENGEDIRGIVLDNFTLLLPLAEYAAIQ